MAGQNGTNVLDYNSPLIRKEWVKQNLAKLRNVSFWSKYTGKNTDSIVYQKNKSNASGGHTVVFDFDGELTGKQYRRNDYSYGKGETKRKFSSVLTVDEFSLYVDNGTKFDAHNCDNLASAEHSDSIAKLGRLFHRHKDQALFDVAQGAIAGNNITHIFDLGNDFTFNDCIDLETAAKKGSGLVRGEQNGMIPSTTPAVKRSPLKAYRPGKDANEDIFLCLLDTYSATKLKKDPNYQTLVATADARSRKNAVLSGVIGQLGQIVFIEAPIFFGQTNAGAGQFTFYDTEIQYAGLRRYAVDDATNNVYWEGTADFDRIEASVISGTPQGAIYSRNILIGAGALQSAFGKQPNYELEWGPFKKSSQSMLEYWAWFQKTVLTVENGKDYAGKIADIDYSTIAVDLKLN